MILGILAIPLAPLLVIGGLAVLFGAASWLRQGGPRPAGRALAGVILGLISLALGLAQHLL
jgi:hypothetical protein